MRGYYNHIQQRFKEKFAKLNACKSKDLTELTDYNIKEITNIALTTNGYLVKPGSKKTIKKVIFYNGVAMWCVIDPKKELIKTIYPISEKQNKILLKLTK